MSAKPVDIAAYRPRLGRRSLARKSAFGNVPIALTAHPDAVAFVVGDREFWLRPDHARDFGEDIIRLAAIAKRGGRK